MMRVISNIFNWSYNNGIIKKKLTDFHDITEILLKVELNTITLTLSAA
jgi:hypothetical protein